MIDGSISQYVVVITDLVSIWIYANRLIPSVAQECPRCGVIYAWSKESQGLVQIISCRDICSVYFIYV